MKSRKCRELGKVKIVGKVGKGGNVGKVKKVGKVGKRNQIVGNQKTKFKKKLSGDQQKCQSR